MFMNTHYSCSDAPYIIVQDAAETISVTLSVETTTTTDNSCSIGPHLPTIPELPRFPKMLQKSETYGGS